MRLAVHSELMPRSELCLLTGMSQEEAGQGLLIPDTPVWHSEVLRSTDLFSEPTKGNLCFQRGASQVTKEPLKPRGHPGKKLPERQKLLAMVFSCRAIIINIGSSSRASSGGGTGVTELSGSSRMRETPGEAEGWAKNQVYHLFLFLNCKIPHTSCVTLGKSFIFLSLNK